MPTAAKKGLEIRFIAGKYAGLSGWVNDAQTSDEKITAVIVHQGRKGEKCTFVHTHSFRYKSIAEAKTKAEAALQQHPNIEKSIVTATRQVASCYITEKNVAGFRNVLVEELDKAREYQEAKGSRARYGKVDWSCP